jgi:hypothetical protein
MENLKTAFDGPHSGRENKDAAYIFVYVTELWLSVPFPIV